MQAKRRFNALDTWRGFILVNMIFYHLLWDLHAFTSIWWSWYEGLPGFIWQQFIAWSFIIISGFSWSFGSKPFKRGLTVFLGGLLITLVTVVMGGEVTVIFGILTFLGSAMILLIPLDKVLRSLSPKIGFLVSLLLFAITRLINQGYLGMMHWEFIPLPDALYRNLLTAYIGFPPTSFYSADYFSLLPWFFLFLAGYFFHHLYKALPAPPFYDSEGIGWLNFLGRHSLIIYLLHQPILFALVQIGTLWQ